MNGYLLCVIGTVLLCSLLTAIAPEGKTSGMVKGIARLVCILAIIAPILRFFKTGEISVFSEKNGEDFFTQSVIDGESSFIQYYSETRVAEAERALEKELVEKYGIQTQIHLRWRLTEEALDAKYKEPRIRIDEIKVQTLNGASEEVKAEMAVYLTKNYCSEVLIE